tara:strand:+ start:2028 stop:3455 length:1428 start_codon:yes stop_codon:yes gene_type:complete
MSIESKEIKDIHALYQNLYEETARERMQRNKERITNPFKNTTIVTKDGKELKQGDDGFDDALANARKTMRDANNKSLNAADRKANEKSGLGSSSSSSSSSSNIKKRIPGESSLSKKEFDAKYDSDDKVVKALDDDEKKKVIKTPSKPKTQRDEVVTKKDTNNTPPAPKTQRDEVITKGGPDRSKTQPNPEKEEKPTPRIGRGQGNRPIASNPNRQGGEPFKKLLQQKQQEKSNKENDVGSDGKPITPNNRGKSINVNRDGSPKPKPGNLSNIGNAIKAGQTDAGKELVKSVTTPAPKKVAPKPEKITARSQMRQRNIDRFGADKVNNLINKQKDFKTMQRGGTQTPFAASQGKLKPGVAKSQFAAKYKDSNVAKDLKKSKGVKKIDPNYESYDAYDLVLIHLLETNQVESVEEANYVMTEMDGKTILEIKRLMESMPSHVRDSIGRQYGTGKYKGEKYTIEDKKNVVNWYSRIKA